MIQLTSTILKNMYTMLVVCKPFDNWNMPLPEQIKFIVDHDPDTMGTYLYDDGGKHEHVIFYVSNVTHYAVIHAVII